MQYNRKLIENYKEASIHYCGQNRKWHNKNIITKGMRSINYGNPEMHDIKEKQNDLCKDKISIVGWGVGQEIDYLREFCRLDIKTGVTLVVEMNSYDEAKKLIYNWKSRNNSI